MPSTYEPIATTTLSSNQTSITFSSIPATYTDLVLIASYNPTVTEQVIWMRFNGDTASNYSRTQLYGTGSAAASNRASNETYSPAFYGGTTTRVSGIVHIFNYANTTTNKTFLFRINDTSINILQGVGLWRKTPEAIHTILIEAQLNQLASGSTFTLYGIKAA
jgi:hypothetical protein